MTYLLQRLAVRLTYLTALFSFQRTLERRNSPPTPLVQIERCILAKIALLSSFHII